MSKQIINEKKDYYYLTKEERKQYSRNNLSVNIFEFFMFFGAIITLMSFIPLIIVYVKTDNLTISIIIGAIFITIGLTLLRLSSIISYKFIEPKAGEWNFNFVKEKFENVGTLNNQKSNYVFFETESNNEYRITYDFRSNEKIVKTILLEK